jgi:phasin family protein
MPTRIVPAKKAAPKTVKPKAPAGKPPTRKPPARSGAAKKPAPVEQASLQDLLARLSKLELAGLAGRLVDGWRKDLQALVSASQRSYAGLQEVVARQTAQIKDAASELHGVGKVMAVAGTAESVRRLDDLAAAALQLALNDIRELSDMTAKSQREAYELVQQRVADNLDEVQRALREK